MLKSKLTSFKIKKEYQPTVFPRHQTSFSELSLKSKSGCKSYFKACTRQVRFRKTGKFYN